MRFTTKPAWPKRFTAAPLTFLIYRNSAPTVPGWSQPIPRYQSRREGAKSIAAGRGAKSDWATVRRMPGAIANRQRPGCRGRPRRVRHFEAGRVRSPCGPSTRAPRTLRRSRARLSVKPEPRPARASRRVRCTTVSLPVSGTRAVEVTWAAPSTSRSPRARGTHHPEFELWADTRRWADRVGPRPMTSPPYSPGFR